MVGINHSLHTGISRLSELEKGEKGKIVSLSLSGDKKKRLMDLGFAPGTDTECLGKSPLGDPVAYWIRGTVIALRKEEAQDIAVLKQPDGEGGTFTVGFAGNPNVGKSTLFNRLTGMHQHTGNWTGKTVDWASGRCCYGGNEYRLVDIPGCYSLNACSPEEKVAGDFIRSKEADCIVIVCDGTCLLRNMNLVLQILGTAGRAVLCVNFLDEMKKKQIAIDFEKLEEELMIPVVGISARGQKCFDDLFEAVQKAVTGKTAKKEREYESEEDLLREAERICKEAVHYGDLDYSKKDRKLDSLFTSPFTGFPVMFLMLLFIFWLTITGANYPSQWLSGIFSRLEGLLLSGASRFLVPKAVSDMLILGIYRVVTWVIAVMLPPMAVFFPLFTLLEDFGYLPRMAFNLDRCFKCCQACGKQALTMAMGFGCNAVGVTGCRIIDSKRERLIAMLTNAFIPCNGRFPTLIALITMFFVGGTGSVASRLLAALYLSGLIMLGVLITFAVSKILSATLLSGMPSSFTLELPPYRKPQFGRVLIQSVRDRMLFVLMRAVAVAAPAGLVIWLLANIPVGGGTVIAGVSAFLDPIGRQLGMDGTILLAFLLGFPANEIVMPLMLMIYLSSGTLAEIGDLASFREVLLVNGWTAKTAVCTAIFCLMHFPCSTTCLTIRKESGENKWMAAGFLIPLATGAACCFAVSHIWDLFLP